jgi:predicted ATPase
MAYATHELVGREREIAASFRMLVEERRAIVTLWGPGGIGKTSLARVALQRCGSSFEGGTHFAALAGARDQVDLLAIVADTLGLGGAGAGSAAEGIARIGRSLAARGRTLLVLDNVEQIVADAAAALVAWSTMAPEASFLITSRELLAVPGEQPCELLPLPTEAAGGNVPEAVRLLVDRARAVRPSFDAESGVLLAIVERLDGMPLAIELAAARLAVMSAEQLLARLDDRFTVLRRGHGNAEQRQRTMHDAIDWSWNLLDEAERRVLEGLSVFRGFDLDAAAAVLGPDVVDTVAALRHKSLIAEAPAGERTGGPRFFLLVSIREFAARELGARAADVRRAHAKHYAAAATGWAAHVDGLGSEDALANLTAEHENLLAVAERFHEAPADALRALVALEAVLTSRGAGNQLALLLGRALASSPPDVPRALRLRALEVQAGAHLGLGQLAEAYAVATSALALPEGDVEIARVLIILGFVRQTQGRFAEAMDLETSALAHAVRGQGRREQGHALANLGLVHHVIDDFEQARSRYEDSLLLLREVGDVRAQVRTHARLGFLLQDLGDPAGAMAHYTEASRLDTAHGLRILEGTLTGYLGNVRRAEGRIDEALAIYDRALARLRLAGDRRFEATFTMDRGIARVVLEQHGEALRDLETATAIAVEIGDRSLTALALGYVIVARASLGDLAGARLAHGEGLTAIGENPTAVELLDVHSAHIELAGSNPDATVRAQATLRRLGDRPLGQHRRLAADLLRRALERIAPPEGAVVLCKNRLRVPNGTWLELDQRPAMAGVIGLLIARRLAAPGSTVSTAELVGVGWPGEKLVSGAGANRLRVLVSGLRSVGLKEVLRSAAGGYFLEPEVPVVSD